MKKEILNRVNGLVLEVLFRSFRVLYRRDSRVRDEIAGWENGLTLRLVCGPGGASLAVCKDEKNGVRRLRRGQRAQITMRFKSVEGAFRVLSGQIGVAGAYAAHLFTLEGDIYQTMSFVRCVDYLEAYLFPPFWSRRILKELPEKQVSPLEVYARILLENKC